MTGYFDFHTHNTAVEPGVFKLINRFPGEPLPPRPDAVYSLGWHPWHLDQAADLMPLVAAAAAAGQLAAIGETGLDRSRGHLPLQESFFQQHLALAARYHLPVIIHNVRCTPELLTHRRTSSQPWLFHRAPTRPGPLRQILATGAYVSFGLDGLRRLAGPNPEYLIPLSRLALETDDSGDDIKSVYQAAAELWQISLPELQAQMKNNFSQLFQIHE